jgi:hypothetical protein
MDLFLRGGYFLKVVGRRHANPSAQKGKLQVRIAIVLSIFICSLSLGCTTYYKVHDPNTGSTYYSTEIDTEDGGAVSLKDDRTNAQVTIQNSEIMELTADQYDAAIRTIVEVEPPAEPTAEPTAGDATDGASSN